MFRMLQIPVLETTILLLFIHRIFKLASAVVGRRAGSFHLSFSMDSLFQSVINSRPVAWLASFVRQTMIQRGVSAERLPSTDVVAFSVLICLLSLLGSLYHWKRRKQLKRELRVAQAKLDYLTEKLSRSSEDEYNLTRHGAKKDIRIFMDGAFDLLHFGHMNAFRLARSLGTHLVVGVNSDESITQCKGAPLMSDIERLTMVNSCKFVDEVIPGCPYIMSSDYLNWAIEKYKIDYVIHGDDPCIVDGKDVYEAAKAAGKFRNIPRTCGVSTTDIVGRMLLLTKDHHFHQEDGIDVESSVLSEDTPSSASRKLGRTSSSLVSLGQQSKFLTTSRMLQLFSADVKAPADGMRVVYIDGAWDLFHPGHVSTLKAARERGDYLIVGIHGDAVVNRVQGMNLPLMNLHERVLSVLGCRYTDDVLIDAPYEITSEMISSLNISEVVRRRRTTQDDRNREAEENRFRHAKEAGILKTIDVGSHFQIGNVIQRIQRNQETFQAKFERKMEAEQRYMESKS